MADSDAEFLDTFPSYLRTLGEDAVSLGEVTAVAELSAPARSALIGGLNYLFKSLDLIPDGIDDIGYLDDAFVLRVACEQAILEDVSGLNPEQLRAVNRLAEDASIVRDFLGTNYPRLADYVRHLRRASARGRSVADIEGDASRKAAFLSDLRAFAASYQAPRFTREEKNLVKLRAFFDAKLPK